MLTGLLAASSKYTLLHQSLLTLDIPFLLFKAPHLSATWFSTSDFKFRTVGIQDFWGDQFDPFDIVVIPETFLPLLPTLSRLRVVIFNQNMHYLCGEDFSFDPALVMQAYSRPNILSVLTVSASDYNYAVDALPLPPSRIHRIVNAIEDDIFSFSFSTNSTIAYMPRKNTSHSRVVLELIQSILVQRF